MKKNLLLALGATAFVLTANATVRTVNNNSNSPGQYTTIQAAVTASSAGDTILVAGSATTYTGTINVNKKLTFIGPGYNPDKQNPLVATTDGAFTLNSSNASGSTIMGFKLMYGINFASGAILNNIAIRRNSIEGGQFTYVSIADSTANLTISENYFSTSGSIRITTAKSHLNMQIVNNIFTGYYPINYVTGAATPTPTNYKPITFAHNLFIAGNNNNPLISINWATLLGGKSVYNVIIKNNIFYNTNGSTGNVYTPFINCTFNNNITFAGASLPLMPSTGNIGSGNINNTDPEFVSIFNTSNTVDFNLDNLRLKSTSPARNAATDGSDIGPTGGTYPIYLSTNQYLTGEPTIPEIKFMNFVGASSTPPGGTLQINVKAKKIN